MKIAKTLKPIFGVLTAIIICLSASISTLAAAEAPKLTASDVDLVPYMEYKTYGKQEDSEDGKRQEITKSKDGVTVKFNSQSIDYGIRFNDDYIKPDGTLYYSFTLDPENDLWEGGTNNIYGGPKIQLAKVAHGEDMFTNYLTIQFTQGDGIDFRIADKAGSDVLYLGGTIAALKTDYPDTKSKNKGTKGYDVVVKLSKIGISMWVNGTQTVDDIHWNSLYDSQGELIPFEFQSFAPGINTAASRTTVHNFRLWCSAADATVKNNSNDKGNSGTSSSGTSSSGTASSGNTTSKVPSGNKNETTSSDVDDKNDNVDTSSDAVTNDKENDKEVVIGDADSGATFVKGEKVEIPSILPTAIIIGVVVLGVGAIVVILYYTIFKKKL